MKAKGHFYWDILPSKMLAAVKHTAAEIGTIVSKLTPFLRYYHF